MVSSIKINEMQNKYEAKTARITVRRSKPLNQRNLGLQQSWCRIVFFPFFDHSTANVTRALANFRECAEIPEAAQTITANSCWERNFGRSRAVTVVHCTGNAGISLKSMGI